MKRDLDALTARRFDVLVVGAGIHGAFAAWDAALRGLSVALVDAGDFGGGASANSLKVVHGGLRYLQQMDLVRMRESIGERSIFLRIAPALVRPLAFVIATRGMGKEGRAALGTALWLTDRIGFDRNAGLRPDRVIPGGRLLTTDELARLAPELPREGASGGALWYDGQTIDSERLTFACVRSAAARGAVVANHVRVTALRREAGQIAGVTAVDAFTHAELSIAARVTIVAAGCETAALVPGEDGATATDEPVALAMNLVTRRRLGGEAAFGVRVPAPSRLDPTGRGARYLFAVPWRDSTMIGTFYRYARASDGARTPSAEDVAECMEEVRSAMPALDLSPRDVGRVHHGVLPLEPERAPGVPRLLANHHRIVDHASMGRPGLISMVGVKYTTGRFAAEQAVNLACMSIQDGSSSQTPDVALDVGPDATALPSADITDADVRRLVRDEMAVTLGDVVLRRTPMGAEACPPRERLEAVARVMGIELGWHDARRQAEIESVRAAFAPCDTGESRGAADTMRVAHG